jgi:hypothetical protein
LPAKYTEICFVDLDATPSDEFEQIHPRMYEAWVSKTQNVFLVPMEEAPIDIGNIYVGPSGYLCLTIAGGRLALRLEGLGDRAAITEWQQ